MSLPTKMMIYGPPGVGKTTVLGTAGMDDRSFPCLYCDFEGGSKAIESKRNVIEDLKDRPKPVKGKVDYYRIKKFKDLEDIYELVSDDDTPYKSVVLDSLSEINSLALDFVVPGSRSGTKFTATPDVQIQHYGKVLGMMKKLVRALRDLQYTHVFVTAFEQMKEMKDEQTQLVMPALIGQASVDVMALVDFVWYMRTTIVSGKPVREFLTGPKGRYYAKSRDEGRTIPLEVRNVDTVGGILDLTGVK